MFIDQVEDVVFAGESFPDVEQITLSKSAPDKPAGIAIQMTCDGIHGDVLKAPNEMTGDLTFKTQDGLEVEINGVAFDGQPGHTDLRFMALMIQAESISIIVR